MVLTEMGVCFTTFWGTFATNIVLIKTGFKNGIGLNEIKPTDLTENVVH